MEKKIIIRLSNLSVVGFILIVLFRLFINYKTDSIYEYNTLRLQTFIATSVYIPIFIITSVAALFVVYYYCKNKFRIPLKHFYLVIPSLIYLVICILAAFGIPG
jgi:hypothetical protein